MVTPLRSPSKIPSVFCRPPALAPRPRCLRTFKIYHPKCISANVTDPEAAAPEKPSVITTKKKYADLPKAHVLADGTIAAPLGTWYGGLGEAHASYDAKLSVLSRHESSGLEAIVLSTTRVAYDVEPPTEETTSKTVKRRKKQTESSAAMPEAVDPPAEETQSDFESHQTSNDFPAEDEDIVKPKRRGRPKKAAALREDSPLVATAPLSISQEDGNPGVESEQPSVDTEIHVDVKPKRKRRTKKATDVLDSASPLKSPSEGISPDEQPELEPQLSVIDLPDELLVKSKRRGRRKKAQVTQEALQQASASASAVPLPSTPLATEIRDNLARFPHCILLTRVGQFYESYFDQAAEVSRLLNIKLALKTWSGQRVLMCGFPLMHLNKYLKMLVQQHNRSVALCEEFLRSPLEGAKGGFDRRVVRIVTPGTLIDEPFLNPYENNYLLSVVSIDTASSTNGIAEPVGIAWIDVSTGDFFTKNTSYEGLRDELVRINPREVVLEKQLLLDDAHPIRTAIIEEGCFTSYYSPSDATGDEVPRVASAGRSGPDDITTQLDLENSVLPDPLTDAEVGAVKLLTAFLHTNLMEHMPRLSPPNRETVDGRMQIDSHTIKALEIREGMREGGTTGSLFSVVKRTLTSSGTRLLARWLCSPSTSITEINARQSLVAFFYSRPFVLQDLVQTLGEVEDATRIVQRFLLGRGDVSDLSAICTTIDIWSSIKNRVELEKHMEHQERGQVTESDWTSLEMLMSRMADLENLAHRIRMALTGENALPSPEIPESGDGTNESLQPSRDHFTVIGGETWTIKPEFSNELKNLHAWLRSLLIERERLERHLQFTYDAPSLSLRTSPSLGMHVHLARGKRDAAKLKASSLFIKISESNSTISFFFQEWSLLGSQIVEVTNSIYAAEREAFETLRSEVNAHSSQLRRNARIVDELDVTLAFARLAMEMNFVRPVLKNDSTYHVVNGRHPTVELGLLTAGRVFTPNTVSFAPDSKLHIITGPNMAGKSTLLRQTALITILAQTGSFVPAEAAEIGIVDRVFSRVGAKDDLFRDRSTFMVEMLETSEILRRATPNSLVIMDEVGRGTTVEDGLAIAFAAVHHLLSVNGCRAMFATHFHELADMLGHTDNHKGQGAFANVGFFCTDVDETEDGYFAYSHRLRSGINRDSHGLRVAQLAGMPDSAVTVAKTALSWLKKRAAGQGDDKVELQTLGQTLALPSCDNPI